MNDQAVSCPVCSGVCAHQRTTTEEENYYACSRCGLEFWHPLKHGGKAFYDTSQGYDIVERDVSWGHRQFLEHLPIKKGTLLDIGCGQGDFLAEACAAGFDIWGVDLAPRNVEFIKNVRGITNHVYCEDLGNFVKREDIPKFDVITLFEVIEHLDAPKELLEKVRTILKPGGYLVMSTPNIERVGGPTESWDVPPNHLTRWSRHSLEKLLSVAGFEDIVVTEQMIDFEYVVMRGALSLGLFRLLRSKKAIVEQTSPEVEHGGSRVQPPRLKVVATKILRALAKAKTVVTKAIYFPYIAFERMKGRKYWDLYATARNNEVSKG